MIVQTLRLSPAAPPAKLPPANSLARHLMSFGVMGGVIVIGVILWWSNTHAKLQKPSTLGNTSSESSTLPKERPTDPLLLMPHANVKAE
jgi:hypothetical protein